MTTAERALVHPRDEIVETMERIYRYRMTTTSGGNISIHDENGDVWITPARVDKGTLTRADIVCVKPDGSTEGRHRPSSEYPFHQAIYEARPELRSVVHAHPVALVAFSICRTTPNTSLFPQALHVCGPEVGYALYELPGSERLGRRIADVFAKGFECVMLENHGAVIGGKDLQEAFQRFETLEFTAKTVIKAGMIGKVRYLNAEQRALSSTPHASPEAFDDGAASTAEREVRRDLCEFIRRGYRQRLLTSTGGSFSARVDGNSFVISSYNVDRNTIAPADLTLIRGGRAEVGKKPSRAWRIHQRIYETHPGIQAVVNATPVNATAFSVTGQRLDARTIPESYLFLGDVPVVPFNTQFGDGREIVSVVAPERPVALMENNGALILGKSILDAFDRLEVLESTAEALINAKAVGEVKVMEGAQIDELRTAFGML